MTAQFIFMTWSLIKVPISIPIFVFLVLGYIIIWSALFFLVTIPSFLLEQL